MSAQPFAAPTSFILLTTASLALLEPGIAIADHGPGTSGGGASTQSGETLKPGKFSLELREEYTEFQHLSTLEVEAKAAKAGNIDLIDRSFLETVSISYGVIENFQIGMTIGYYHAVRAREAEFDPLTGDTEINTFDPDGITDLWLTGKYRFYRGPLGQFAVFGGVKFPTGRNRVTNSAGASVEPSATAGSGSYDGMAGLAYSRFLTSRVTLDTSAQYTIRSEAHDFRLGDRFDAGLAAAYRLVEDIQSYPQFNVFGEANVRHLFRSKDAGVEDPNTGGTALFLTPGVRASLNQNLSFTLFAPIPVWQRLNGEQLKTDYKVSAALTLGF